MVSLYSSNGTLFVSVHHMFQLWSLIFFPVKKICNFCSGKFQKVSTHTICSWDDSFTQAWNNSSHTSMSNCNKSPSTISNRTTIEWKLYLLRCNRAVASLSFKMNVGGHPRNQNNTRNTDRYKGYFFNCRATHTKVNTMKKVLCIGLSCRLLHVW